MGSLIQTKPLSSSPHKPRFWLWCGALLALSIWIGVDLLVPHRSSIRDFDPGEVARLETAMWRSYYDKKPVLLFWQLAKGLREQFHAPFWRSVKVGFQATKAAFAFKQSGPLRTANQRALPELITYYSAIQDLSVEQFDVPRVAKLELEWWIVHRQRKRYSYTDLAHALGQTTAALYNQPPSSFVTYGRLRANAMRLCDEVRQQPGGVTEVDWQRIDLELAQAWSALYESVHLLDDR